MLFHKTVISPTWEETSTPPFRELVISWSANRPQTGKNTIFTSLLIDASWSLETPYAVWTKEGGHSYIYEDPKGFFKLEQDTFSLTKQATGFRIRIDGPLENFRMLHASLKGPILSTTTYSKSICLEIPKLSQMTLKDPRRQRLCSPTSIASVLSYLSSTQIDPIQIANRVHDEAFDIYGNWPLNTAEAAHILGAPWCAFVAHSSNFDPIYKSLEKGLPVITSIRGPLPGSASAYESGHLVVVRGYDAKQNLVLCMDPAFSTPEETLTSYPLPLFLKAWERRSNIGYFFSPNDSLA